ncbi:MAG TPA: phosphomannomutase [Bryobacteraceae bacterium]|nr:phosphomannomutase [Bryobacteraceae bacterium]
MNLRQSLRCTPVELQFGTSGRRGLVVDLTQLEVYINALAELEYLQSLPREEGGIVRSEEFYFARDLRPSSGKIAEAIVQAMRDAGMAPVNLGLVPTPAITYHALEHGRGSMMITGSHIPFDRNGYKANSSKGELLKEQEGPINARVAEVRARLYAEDPERSAFDADGNLKQPVEWPPETHTDWVRRFADFFPGKLLAGKRVLVYQHSAVGRDLLVVTLRELGAEVVPAGRSNTFVPIDTENIGAPELAAIQALVDANGSFDAVVSTDGDSDRPLVLGVENGKAPFFGGDLVGMIVAEYLGADAVVVPVTCNDGVDRGALAGVLEPKTRIGSPFVIAGMEAARKKGKKRVCGWEPNGGFLVGSDIERDGRVLKALATRDAFLPVVTVLVAAAEQGCAVSDLFARLPRRFSKAALVRNFARAVSLKILESLDEAAVARYFSPELGFGAVSRIDGTDGIRVMFSNGDVAHVRPSGNADELRIYAVADSQARADEIVAMGVREPDGILRAMEIGVIGRG